MDEESSKFEDANKPIHGRVTGGKFGSAFTEKEYASRAVQMKKEGFTAIKFDLDVPTPYSRNYDLASGSLSNKEVDYLAGLAGAVRETVGEETDILFDLHWRYNIQSSINLAKSLEKYHLMWLEEPVPPGAASLIDLVASSTSTPMRRERTSTGDTAFNH